MREQHWPFAAGVVAALAGTAALGALLEVTVLRRLYRRSELEQVLFTIGLSFVFVAGANLLAGPEVQLIPLPAALAGPVDLGFRTLPAQRLLVVGCGLAVLAGSVWLMARTRFGVWLRATVDNTATASALAIPVQRVYVLTSPRGGAGGLGGISVPRDAPIRFTRSSISSSCLSSWRWRNGELRRLLRRSAQPRHRRDREQVLGFGMGQPVFLRRDGAAARVATARPVEVAGRMTMATTATLALSVRILPLRTALRAALPIVALGALALVVLLFFPEQYPIATRIAVMAIFVMSLDLVVGYGGLATLGHAAVFGAGAYAAGLFATHIHADPLLGLAAGAAAGGVVAALSGLFLLRYEGLTFLMLSIAVAQILQSVASKLRDWTGGDDGLSGYRMNPLLGVLPFDLTGRTGFVYAAVVLIGCLVVLAS